MADEFNPHDFELKWRKKWDEAKAFESDPQDKRPKYFLTVPYPYASGALHVGHARSYTLGDVTARYHRMCGKNVLFPMASHITGTPILAISRKIGQKDKKALDGNREYVSYYVSDKKEAEKIVAGFSDPANVASFYATAIRKDFESMGYAIDWRRFFTTGDKAYNAFIRWQYKHLNDKGFIVKGNHPVFFCPNCGNPVTTDDIKSGDEYEIGMSEFYLIKMGFADGFIVAATLRPETLFGVVNTWVHPKETYVKAEVDGEIWYAAEKFVEKLGNQQRKVKVLEKFTGEKLLNKTVSIPLADRKVRIFPAEFVDVDIASGVVNSVPAHAPFDYVANEEVKKTLGLAVEYIPLIEVEGYSKLPAKDLVEKEGIKSQTELEKLEKITQILYKDEFYRGMTNENCGEFAHMRVSQAKDAVVEKLKESNLITTIYEKNIKDKSGAAVKEPKCRCGANLTIKVLSDQWFLDYGNISWKELARELLLRMDINPEMYRKGFEHTIDWLHEWPCTRNRGLGTKFPLDERWMIESLSDSTIYMAYYTIAHTITKEKLATSQLTYELFDYVFLGQGDLPQVEKKTGIRKNILEKLRKEFTYWYPMDERRTGTAHISNHLTFMLFHHTAVFPSSLWPKKISLNEMLIAEGQKMSKSLGNVVPIHESVGKNGADTVRFYLIYAADPDTTLDWRESGVETTKKRIKQFYDMIGGVSALANDVSGERDIDRWLLSRLNSTIEKTRAALDASSARVGLQHAFYDMLSDLNWYTRRSIKPNKKVLSEYARTWVKLATPFIPYTCEELWERLGGKGFASNAEYPTADKTRINARVEAKEKTLESLLADVQNILAVAKITPKKINLYLAPDWKRRTYGMIKEGKDVKDIMADAEIKKYGKDAAKIAQTRPEQLPQYVYALDEEHELLSGAKEFLAKEFNCEIAVQKTPDHDPEGKSTFALPGKPGIYLE